MVVSSGVMASSPSIEKHTLTTDPQKEILQHCYETTAAKETFQRPQSFSFSSSFMMNRIHTLSSSEINKDCINDSTVLGIVETKTKTKSKTKTKTTTVEKQQPIKNRVQFLSTNEIFVYDHPINVLLVNNSKEDRRRRKEEFWYSSTFISQTRKENYILARKLYHNELPEDVAIEHTLRGIEHLAEEQEQEQDEYYRNRRRSLKVWSVKAVLAEQNRQFFSVGVFPPIYDTRLIAEVYIKNGAKQCQEHAHEMGLKDYQEVLRINHKDSTTNSMDSHAALAIQDRNVPVNAATATATATATHNKKKKNHKKKPNHTITTNHNKMTTTKDGSGSFLNASLMCAPSSQYSTGKNGKRTTSSSPSSKSNKSKNRIPAANKSIRREKTSTESTSFL